MGDYPENLKYTKTHEWVNIKEDEAVVGITDYAVTELSDIVFVELPEVGKGVTRDSPFGEIESVKAVFELNSPVSGEVVAVNERLSGEPGIVSESPYEDGWIIRVRISDRKETENLLTSEEYGKFVESEGTH